MANSPEEEMYFFIADISGYTAYMLKNEMDYTHGTLIVNELIKSLVKEVQMPMEISKLEGDAIFLFLKNDQIPQEIRDNPLFLGQKMLQFFTVFSCKLKELQHSTACDCGGCSNIDKLNLKMVAHFGKAAIDTIGSFRELSGVDVILVHRLLKNQAKKKRYLLMTEAAHSRLLLPEGKLDQWEEHDKDIGTIPVFVYYPPEEEILSEKKALTFFEKTKSHFKLAIGGALLKCGLKKPGNFNHFPPKNLSQ